MKKIVLTFLLFLCLPFSTQATREHQAIEEKIKPCIACHGSKGISTHAEWPNLAGQHAAYLVKQLQDYQQHRRHSAVMSPMVTTLTKADITEMAAFYAALPPPKTSISKKSHPRGEQLYRMGDFRKHITACIVCHGPKGTGNAQAGFPWLSGQHPAYTLQQLQAFKTKERHNDLQGIMHVISTHMDTEDMKAVAYYMRGLH